MPDNSAMQQRMGQQPVGTDQAAAAPVLDEGAASLLADFDKFQAEYGGVFGQASGLVQKAHSAQDTGDLPGRGAAVAALQDINAAILWQLDWFLPGQGIVQQLLDYGTGDPSLAKVPAFREGFLKAYNFSLLVKQQRDLIIPFLVPHSVHGKTIPAIPSIPLESLSYTDAVQGQEGLLEPLFTVAAEVRTLLAGAANATGSAAAAIATDVAAGPISDFAPGSGEFEYLYLVVRNSKASADVKSRIDWLLGRDDFAAYEGMYGMASTPGAMVTVENETRAGTAPAPHPALGPMSGRMSGPMSTPGDSPWLDDESLDENGICYAPGAGKASGMSMGPLNPFGMTIAPRGSATPTPAVDPQTKIAPGAVADSAATKVAGVREFDSSEMPEHEEEEEKPKTSNGKPSDRGMARTQITTTRDGKMVVGDGKVEGEASGKRTMKKRSGEASELGVSGKIEAGENLSGSGKIAGKRIGKNGGTASGSAEAGRDEEGHFTGKLRVDGGFADKKGNGTAIGKTIAYDNANGVNVGTDVTGTKKNPNGSTTATTGGVNVTQNGKVTLSGGRTTEDAKGNKSGTTGNASYDAKSGEFAGGVKFAKTDKAGEDQGSIGATGAIDLDGKDGKTGAKGSISASKGGKTLSASGGYSVKIEKPVQDGKRWVVTWETDLSGQLSGGVKGKKAGASATIGGDRKKSGRKSFASEAAAQAFFDNPKLDGMPADATEVAQMGEGDTRGTESSYNVGGDVNASIGMVEVGAGGSHSSSDYQTITKGQGGKVRVEIGTKELDEVHGSIGMAGVSGGAGKSWANQESLTVEFDLDTPEGAKAYAHHQKFHALPRGARGWKVVGDAKGSAETNSYSLGLLGVKLGSAHTVSHEVEHVDGDKYERDAGTDSTSVSVPLLGSYSRSHRLSMLQVNDGRSFFNTESTVKGSDLDDVQSGLAKSAMGTEEGRGGSNKGTYRLQSAISEADMETFIQAALAPDAEHTFNYAGGLHATDGLDDLRSGLQKAAGDKDRQRQVLARWVADEGADALHTLHAITHGKFDESGGGGTAMYVAIDGDPYMDGMKGQLDLELRIQGWDKRLGLGERGPALASEIRKDIIFQREKSKHLEDCGELPHRVYEQEYDRIRNNVAILDSVLLRSLESDGAAPNTTTGLESPRFQAFRRATANLAVARVACDHALEHAYPKYMIEVKGSFSFDGKGREQDLPGEKAAYTEAHNAYDSGAIARNAALTAESLSNQTLDETSVAPLTAMVTKARSEYLRSERFYKRAADLWDDIGMRNIGKAHRDYYGQRMVPGS